MNKPLLQWKRDIEKKLKERNYKLNLVEYHLKHQPLQSLIDEKKIIINDIKHLKEQLQMIDDIIEQQQENMKSLKNYEFDDYYDVKWNYYEQQCIADYINTFIL